MIPFSVSPDLIAANISSTVSNFTSDEIAPRLICLTL